MRFVVVIVLDLFSQNMIKMLSNFVSIDLFLHEGTFSFKKEVISHTINIIRPEPDAFYYVDKLSQNFHRFIILCIMLNYIK